MPVILPFRPSIGNYTFRSILIGVEYRFKVHWNSREEAYYFDVREITNEPIVYGVKAVLGVYFGRETTHPLFRKGAMVCRVPQGDDRREARFEDFGTRVQVWFFTVDEVVDEIIGNLVRGGP